MDFKIADYLFTATLPNSSAEPQVWTLVVTRGEEEVRWETLPLVYPPTFGPDVGDVATLNARVEEVIKELGLS